MLSQSSSSAKLSKKDKFSEYEIKLNNCWDKFTALSSDLRLDKDNPTKNQKWSEHTKITADLMNNIMMDLNAHNNSSIEKYSSSHIRLYFKSLALYFKVAKKLTQLEQANGKLNTNEIQQLTVLIFMYANSQYKSISIDNDQYGQNALEIVFAAWLKASYKTKWEPATHQLLVRYLKKAISECKNPTIKLSLFHYLYYVSAKFPNTYLAEFNASVSDHRVP